MAESQLIDGDIKLYAGVSVEEYSRGERKGDPKYEVFLYAKDNNGKQYVPIIDGVAATASQYMSMLTTELTFSLPDLFSENQTTHRKLIERLFKPELDKLGAEALWPKYWKPKQKGIQLERYVRETEPIWNSSMPKVTRKRSCLCSKK